MRICIGGIRIWSLWCDFYGERKADFIENQIDMILLDVNLQDGEGFSQMRLKKHMACYANSRGWELRIFFKAAEHLVKHAKSLISQADYYPRMVTSFGACV